MLDKRWTALIFLALTLFLAVACGGNGAEEAASVDVAPASIELSSSAFAEGESIPVQYTCDGDNVSPPLQWQNVPEGSTSLALIADDPDAPVGTFAHWVAYNLPPETAELPEDIPSGDTMAGGGRQGQNGRDQAGYTGPCPPSGTHRYFFKLYALDTELDLEAGASKEELLEAMEGHVLARGELMGRYQRQ